MIRGYGVLQRVVFSSRLHIWHRSEIKLQTAAATSVPGCPLLAVQRLEGLGDLPRHLGLNFRLDLVERSQGRDGRA